MIKGKYLGTIKDDKKRQIRTGGDKFKQVFLFDWDANEDTSQDINPLYAKKHNPKILFGKGYMGGIDQNEQKRVYDSKSGTKRQEYLKDDEDVNKKPK